MELNSKTLNKAFKAYVKTFDRLDKLQCFIAAHDLVDKEEDIINELNSLLSCIWDFLCEYPYEISWDKSFEQELKEHVVSRFTWLEKTSFKRVLAYASWICWHEGLNKQ